MIYIALTIIIIFCLFLIYKKVQKFRSNKLSEELLKNWGEAPDINYKEDDFKYISRYFKSKHNDNEFYIDDITWNDIGMKDVFKKINSTNSFIGESFLYYLLRKPEFESKILDYRKDVIDLFIGKENLRVDIQKSLMKLGKDRLIDVVDYVDYKDKSSLLKSILYRILSLLAVFSLAVTAYDLALGVKFILVIFIINLITYHLAMMKVEADLKVINNIANIINASKEISNIEDNEIKEYKDKLSKLYDKVKHINKKTLTISYNNDNEIAQYIKIFTLAEIVNYNKISKSICKYKEEILELYSVLGELDALISVASYKNSLSYYSIPELCNDEKLHLNIEDLYHPLIDNPVSNSIDTAKSVLITGSNASGKSTFLRSVAISSVLAQTINLSLSKSHKSSYFKILTSMDISDDLSKGESYYMSEIKSIKRIIDNLSDGIPTLSFVDEVLRGTNTIERIAASSKILEYLSNNNCMCFTATHDIELASILKDNFDNYHFREEFINNEISFDYKLYNGKSQSRNAIKLLNIIGFDNTIVENAESLAEKYERTGCW